MMKVIWLIILTVVVTLIIIYFFVPSFAKISTLDKILLTASIWCITSTVLAILFFGFEPHDNGSDYNSGQVNF